MQHRLQASLIFAKPISLQTSPGDPRRMHLHHRWQLLTPISTTQSTQAKPVEQQGDQALTQLQPCIIVHAPDLEPSSITFSQQEHFLGTNVMRKPTSCQSVLPPTSTSTLSLSSSGGTGKDSGQISRWYTSLYQAS